MCAKAKKSPVHPANTAVLRNPIAAAQIVKSYNTNGEVVIKLTCDLLEDFNLKEPVFIYFDELPVPFFIEAFTPKGTSGAIIKLQGIHDLSHAEELIQKTIFLEEDTLSPQALENATKEDLGAYITGFSLTDQAGKPIGIISGYFEYPNNPCIEVSLHSGIHSTLWEIQEGKATNARKETVTTKQPVAANHPKPESTELEEVALIPFHEHLILAFDPAGKEIQMKIPEGLLIY